MLLGTYIATRLVTPPLAPNAGAEPVDVLGVLTAGVELASVVAVLALPARAGRSSARSKTLWAAAVATVYAAFFAVASASVVYCPGAHRRRAPAGQPPARPGSRARLRRRAGVAAWRLCSLSSAPALFALLAVYTPLLLAAVALVLALHGSAMLRALRLGNPATRCPASTPN